MIRANTAPSHGSPRTGEHAAVANRVSVRRRIKATPLATYAVIADYENAHPRILPKVFRNLVVEAGGTGEGTTIRFDVRVFGVVRQMRAQIAEPSPGHVLTERDLDTGTLTTFLVKPADSGRACDVTITTDLKVVGPLASLQAKVALWVLRRAYVEELDLLEAEARRRDDSIDSSAD